VNNVTPQTQKRLILILIFGIPLGIFIGAIFYNAFNLTSPPPLPNPNGYDDLMKAAKMLAPGVVTYTNRDLNGLKTIVSEDADALQLARTGLQKQCRVPLDYNPASPANLDRIADLKHLAYGFAVEGDLAEMQGHPDQAAKSYLDIIHFANESSRGGVLIDELVGIAIEHIGTGKLQQLTPQLDGKTCCETAAALQTLDAQRQPWDDVMRQEDYWARRARPGIQHEIVRMMQYKEIKKINQTAERRYEEQQTRTRKLIIDLAARAYELDKGHPPSAISDLVPDYLKVIPQDPLTGTNMVYLP
jgi:hypothetical protein